MKWRILLCLWFLSSLNSMGIEKNQEYHFEDDDFNTRRLDGFHGGRRSEDDVVQRIFFNVKTDVWYLKRQIKVLSHQSNIIISNISRLMKDIDDVDDVKNSLYKLTANISQFYNSMKKNFNGIKNNYYILSSNVSDVSQRFDLVESLWPGILLQVNSTMERISDLADSHDQLKQLTRQQGHLITSGIGRLEQKLDVSLAAHNMEVSRLRNDIVSYVLNVQDQVMEVQRAVEKIFQCSCLDSGKFMNSRTYSPSKSNDYLMSSYPNELSPLNQYSSYFPLETSKLISNISKIQNQIDRPLRVLGGVGSLLLLSNLPFALVSNISSSINISGSMPSQEGPTGLPPVYTPTQFNGQYTKTTSATIIPAPYRPTQRPPTQPPTYRPPTYTTPPNGQPPNGQPPTYRPPNGQPPNGQPPAYEPPGVHPPGSYPPNGQPPNGQPPNGQPPNGQPPTYRPPNGQPPAYEPPGVQPPGGYPPNGQPPTYRPPNGQPPAYEPPGVYPPGGYAPNVQPPTYGPPAHEMTSTYRPPYTPLTSTMSSVYEHKTTYYPTSDRTTTTHKPMLMQPPIQLGFDGPFKDMCVCICSCPCSCPTFSAMLFPKEYSVELTKWIDFYYQSHGIIKTASTCSCLCTCPCDGSDIMTSGPLITESMIPPTPHYIPQTTKSYTTLFTTEHFDIDIDIENEVGGWPQNDRPPASTARPPAENKTEQFIKCVLSLCSEGQRFQKEVRIFKKVMLEKMEVNKGAIITHVNTKTDDLRHFLTDIHSSTYNLNYDNKNTTLLMHMEMRKKFDEMHYSIKVVSDILIKLNHEIDIIQSKLAAHKPLNQGHNKPSNGDNYQSNYDPHDFNNPSNWPHNRLLPVINMVNSNKTKTELFDELRKNISNIIQEENLSKNDSTVRLKSEKRVSFIDENYSNGGLDSSEVDDYVDNDNLIKKNSDPIESSNLMEFDSPLRNHVNWHLRKSNSDESIKKPNYRSLNSYYRNRSSPKKIIIHPLIPNINAYLKKYKANPLTFHRPASKDRKPMRTRPHKFPSLRPQVIDAVNKGKTYSYSYSDGHGKNLNINVHRRKNLTKSTTSKDNHDNKLQNDSSKDIPTNNDDTEFSESLES